ncbi:MAG: ankyrin repeat domain-containing protein [Bryobacteraceae bacterium]
MLWKLMRVLPRSLPLQAAAELGNLHIIEMLSAAGAQINTKSAAGRTALHVAVIGNHLDIIQFLIEKGAEIDTLRMMYL